jgi:hypothetical protein
MEVKEIKNKLTKAFRELRKLGYFARQNFWCCQSCGCNAVPDEYSEKYVFYHGQDNDCLNERGECYLAWSGDGAQIVKVLEDTGLKVTWDNNEFTRILVGKPEGA